MADDMNVPTQSAQSSDIVTRLRRWIDNDSPWLNQLDDDLGAAADLLDAIDALHQSDPLLGSECAECFHVWPCKTARLLHHEVTE